MRLITCLLVAVSISGLVACSADHAGVKGLSQEDADRLNAQNSRFESQEDPPITADTHVAAAEFAVSQGRIPVAITQFEQALKINPEHLRATYGLAMIYTQQKLYDKAIGQWQRYVEISGGQAAAYANLGYCCELAGKPDQAEKAYNDGIKKDPSNEACRVNYGLMLARHGRIADAVIQLQAVLTQTQVHYNLGSVYEQQGRLEQAKVEYRKALELDGSFSDAKQRLAAIESK